MSGTLTRPQAWYSATRIWLCTLVSVLIHVSALSNHDLTMCAVSFAHTQASSDGLVATFTRASWLCTWCWCGLYTRWGEVGLPEST